MLHIVTGGTTQSHTISEQETANANNILNLGISSIPALIMEIIGSPNNPKTQDAATVVKTCTVREKNEKNVGEEENTESFKQTNFAEKIYMLLNRAEFQDVFQWLPSGDAFCVTDQDAFKSKILSKYFPSAQFHSFARRMRRWGFQRVESKQQRSRGIIMFKCVLFRRGRPDLCKLMCDDRHIKKLKKVNETAKNFARIDGSPLHTLSVNSDITDRRDIATNSGKHHCSSLPPLINASTVGLQHLNASRSAFRSYSGQYCPTVDLTATQQAFKQTPIMDHFLSYDRHSFGHPAPGISFYLAYPTTNIKMLDNTIADLASFNHSIQPELPPSASKRIGRVELNRIRDRIEAELTVVSQMRQLKQRSLSLAAARVANNQEAFLLSSQRSHDTSDFNFTSRMSWNL